MLGVTVDARGRRVGHPTESSGILNPLPISSAPQPPPRLRGSTFHGQYGAIAKARSAEESYWEIRWPLPLVALA